MLILLTKMKATCLIPEPSDGVYVDEKEMFTPTGPFCISRRSNKLADAPDPDRIWSGFRDVSEKRFYNRRLAVNTYHHQHTRWFKGAFNYGMGNLTPQGKALFDAIANLPEAIAGAVYELWLPWEWRSEFGDLVRLHIDTDDLNGIVEHLIRVARQIYGEDVEIVVDREFAASVRRVFGEDTKITIDSQ